MTSEEKVAAMIGLRQRLREEAHWAGTDVDSQAKFKIAMAKQFGLTIDDVEGGMAEVAAERVRTYRNQFGSDYAPPPEVLAALTANGWEDWSWGNDVCPSWRKDNLVVWVDIANPAERELPTKRFTVMVAVTTDDLGDTVFQCEEPAEIVAWIETRK